MTAEHTQIVKAYEDLHLGPLDIAEQRDLPILEVKMVLAQFSSKYRKDVGDDKDGKKQLDFTDSQLEEANQVIHRLMNSEDENIQYRCARYIRDDKKGRKDGLKNLKKLNINVSLFNEQTMKNALRSIAASKQLNDAGPQTSSNVVDVQEVKEESKAA